MNKLSVCEEALLGLCKMAGVKSPSDLIGSKINILSSFGFSESGFSNTEIKIFYTIQLITIVNNHKEQTSTVFIRFNGGVSINGKFLYGLEYFPAETKWRLVRVDTETEMTVEKYDTMFLFPRKWWQF